MSPPLSESLRSIERVPKCGTVLVRTLQARSKGVFPSIGPFRVGSNIRLSSMIPSGDIRESHCRNDSIDTRETSVVATGVYVPQKVDGRLRGREVCGSPTRR